jgi:general secretion pathway protein I
MKGAHARGFTLVEVMVALMIVALGLGALMVAVTSTARTSKYLRDKTLAEWIALNHLSELRLSANKSGLATTTQSTLSSQTSDATEVKFANRTWHYDTRYFDTSFTSMKRIVVRVYAGDAKTKGNPLAEAASFTGTAVAAAGSSNNSDWTAGQTTTVSPALTPGTTGSPGLQAPVRNPATNPTPTPAPTNPTQPEEP